MGFIGIRSIVLSSRETAGAHYDYIRKFNTMNHYHVLICPFSLKMVGYYMRTVCSQDLCLEQPWNLPPSSKLPSVSDG